MNEIWKDVVGYEGLYSVSNFGNIKGLKKSVKCGKRILNIPEREIKKKLNEHGYYRVALCKEGKLSYQLLHRLVGKAFIENKHNKPYINHIDRSRTNNYTTNLEWCTPGENVRHSWRVNPYDRKQGNKGTINNVGSKPVYQLNKKGEIIKLFNSAPEAELETGIKRKNIANAANPNRPHRTSGKFIWVYKENINQWRQIEK